MPKYIEQRRRLWYAVLDVPKDVREAISTRRYVKSLETDSQATALRRAAPIIAKWKGDIEAARKGTTDPIQQDIEFWKSALNSTTTEDEECIIKEFAAEAAEKLERQEEGAGVRMYKTATGELVPTTEYVDEWLASLQDTDKTKDMKRSEVDRFAVVFPTLDTITKKAVKRWCVGLMGDDGLKFKTINKNLSFLRSYWSHLTSIEVVGDDYAPLHNLGLGGKAAKASKQDETVPFSPEDVVRLRSMAEENKDHKLADLITLAMWSGARIEELCSLRIENVKEDTFKIEDAKTTAGWREVPIHFKLKPTMDRLLKGAKKDGYVLSGLLANKYGDRSNAIGKRFGTMKTGMGFKSRVETFHSIRGTVATLLENAGIPEGVAADILGHEKPTVTYGVYSGGAHLEVMRDALEKMNYPC